MSNPHSSVLLSEVLHAFDNRKLNSFVDATLGAGGHSEALLKAHPEIKNFLGFDQDPIALGIAQKRLEAWNDKATFISGNFVDLQQALKKHLLNNVDGILIDLGVSSMQLDMAEKGFSFMRDGPLDMRMNPDNPLTAAQIVNNWPESDLAKIFRDYGEEQRWRAAAHAVVTARLQRPIETTQDLVNILRPVLFNRKKNIHPLTLVFQALRICVNDELGVLQRVIPQAIEALSPGGRLAVISFHSLEDRIVKNCFRFAASDKESTQGLEGLFIDKAPTVEIITRKPILPSDDEIAANPRSRSAKLRIVEKL